MLRKRTRIKPDWLFLSWKLETFETQEIALTMFLTALNLKKKSQIYKNDKNNVCCFFQVLFLSAFPLCNEVKFDNVPV